MLSAVVKYLRIYDSRQFVTQWFLCQRDSRLLNVAVTQYSDNAVTQYSENSQSDHPRRCSSDILLYLEGES